MPETRLQRTRRMYAEVDARSDEGVQGEAAPQRVEEGTGGDEPEASYSDRTLRAEERRLEDKTGISIRFVKQYDVKKDQMPFCGVQSEGYSCDRPAGHSGSHRSYNWQVDEPVFWLTRP